MNDEHYMQGVKLVIEAKGSMRQCYINQGKDDCSQCKYWSKRTACAVFDRIEQELECSDEGELWTATGALPVFEKVYSRLIKEIIESE